MFAHPFRTFVLSYHINSRKYTFNINGLVGAMPTSPHLAITNSPKVIVKSVRSAGSMCSIDPYAEPGKSQGIRRGGRLCPPAEKSGFHGTLRRIRNFPWADRVVRPYKSLQITAKASLLSGREAFALKQRFYALCFSSFRLRK